MEKLHPNFQIIIDRVFDGSSTSLVQQLTGAKMSDEELDQIKAIIDKASQAEE